MFIDVGLVDLIEYNVWVYVGVGKDLVDRSETVLYLVKAIVNVKWMWLMMICDWRNNTWSGRDQRYIFLSSLNSLSWFQNNDMPKKPLYLVFCVCQLSSPPCTRMISGVDQDVASFQSSRHLRRRKRKRNQTHGPVGEVPPIMFGGCRILPFAACCMNHV